MASAAVPPEPPAAHRPTTVQRPPQDWWRAHPFNPVTGRFASTAFNSTAGSNARFSPLLDASGHVIASIYAANTIEVALMESVLHDVPFPSTGYQHNFKRDRAGSYHVSRVRTTATLTLVDLSTLGLSAMGLQPSDLFESNKPDYPRTRRWAQWLRQQWPSAAGLSWMSRRDNRSEAIVLFEDRMARGALVEVAAPKHVSAFESTTLALLAQMGASAAPDL